MSKKRPHGQTSVDTQLVEIYDDLANEDEEIRLKAAHAFLIKFSPKDNHSSEQLFETLRRLVRGLCSGRKAARIGFSVALTEFLSQHWGALSHTEGTLQISSLIDVLVKQTEVTGNITGQEERDHRFGRLFGAEAFIKSGILLQDNISAKVWDRIFDVIYEAAKNKPWLREECGWILYETVGTLSEGNHDPSIIQTLLGKLDQFGLTKTPEGIAIWLKVQGQSPKVELPAGIWQNESPLDRKEKSKLAKILKETTSSEHSDETSAAVSQRGSWTSRIHFAWNVVFSELIMAKPTRGTKPQSKTITFEAFWKEAVDEQLFASTSSDERKYWGFLLFQQLFGSAPRVFLTALFTPNFMRCLTNQLASKERYLHRAAEKTITTIMNRAISEPSVASTALKGLLANSSDKNVSFDKQTKTKTVERLMALCDDSSLRHVVPELCDRLLRPGAMDEKNATARRQITIDQLTFLLQSRQSSTTQDSRSSASTALTCHILEVFATYSYFSLKDTHSDRPDCPLPPMSARTQDTLKTRLSTCLAQTLSRSPNPALFASHVVGIVLRHEADERMQSVLDFTSTLGDTLSYARTFLENIHKEESSEPGDKTSLHAFQLLYLVTLLQIYNGDADAVSMLKELQSCYDTLFERRQTVDQSGSEALIEILLSFVAKPSQLFRRLAQQVFTAFISDIQHEGLQPMIKVLETKENLSGQDEIFEDTATHSMNSSSTDSSAAEEMEMTNGNGIELSSDDGNGLRIPSESSEAEDETKEEDQELLAFNLKLAQALKTRPINGDTDGAGSEDSSDEDMDDEQMEALDEHIASMFEGRKKTVSRKKQNMDAKKTIVDFKCRALELLEIFVKKRHRDMLVLDLLMPLLTVIRTTTSSLVSRKACNVMRNLSKLCKGQKVPHIDNEAAFVKLLKEIHVEARRESSNAHASACGQASLLVVKVLVVHDKENVRKVVKIYDDMQVLDPQCRVKKFFYTDWLNWRNTAKPALESAGLCQL
ncbi:MAG: hypothetical protein Q9178_003086 [Gyalolechia marmorata]